ncbi:MAG: GNAT family N-acetyltransferase [Actinobacteria bacterium]|nr:MAG: GNAT family N-acetyltransferase [Actinomycetota bacterium]
MLEVWPLLEADVPWAVELQRDSWGDMAVARRGELVDPSGLPGFVAFLDGERAGLATYAVRGDSCEVVTIRSLQEGCGVGRALLDAVRAAAAESGCRRLWLITTNDNTRALDVYQRWGMEIVAFYHDAVALSRQVKPSIPERGRSGIPMEHEFELELRLDGP